MALCDATARSQRWLPWPTGTDWRCEPRSSPPRATSQWPTHDLDRPRFTLAPPPASSAFYVSKVPNRPTVLARCYSPTLPQNAALCHRFHSFFFLLSRPLLSFFHRRSSVFLSISPYIYNFSFPLYSPSLFSTSHRLLLYLSAGACNVARAQVKDSRSKARDSLNGQWGGESRVYFGGRCSSPNGGNVSTLLTSSLCLELPRS